MTGSDESAEVAPGAGRSPTPPDASPGGRAGSGVPAEAVTLFAAVGGRPFFDRVVDRFYDAVAADPRLRPLYPDDLTESRAHLAGFLAQYWGGGTTHYSDARGHPRLRMRHAPFAIGVEEARAWFGHMEAAVVAEDLPAEVTAALVEYFASAAGHLVNTG